MGAKLNTTDFITRAEKKHADLYDYSRVNYTGWAIKVEIVCKKHGSFSQTPGKHLLGQGCPRCARTGFKKEAPALLYYFRDRLTNLYKIGITNNSIRKRFGSKTKEIDLLNIWPFAVGEVAYQKEQKILQECSLFRTINLNFKKIGGHTEFFTKNIINEIKEIL